MNYILQINSFWKDYGADEQLSPTSIAVYFALLHLNNVSGWKPKINVYPREITDLIMIGTPKTLYHHLDLLQTLGLIRYRSGKNQFRNATVEIPCLYIARKVEGQKLPEQSNSNEKAPSEQIPTQTTQVTDNQTDYNTPKQVNDKIIKPKKNKLSVLDDLEVSLLTIYQEFIKKRTGLPAKLNSQDNLSLKQLVKYLYELGNAEEIWEKILSNWHKLNSYYQSKISLEQIDKNFTSIIDQIENHHESNKSDNSAPKISQQHALKRKDFKF
ncbi:hypothetical protein GCM10009122_03070 [Fulvivirga kasyanovii]|uniref:Helix-turn-helix domain-containing protein n=1 Tax=Fulvivirga kasyanovii TaxID=396812 RepID=A0ABW9RK78_9BACT|nr:hypothetical protein [Fulvivirga kasyanovii]MTI24366.1 hypothetical protein [Fulvivirga kasyanovii]